MSFLKTKGWIWKTKIQITITIQKFVARLKKERKRKKDQQQILNKDLNKKPKITTNKKKKILNWPKIPLFLVILVEFEVPFELLPLILQVFVLVLQTKSCMFLDHSQLKQELNALAFQLHSHLVVCHLPFCFVCGKKKEHGYFFFIRNVRNISN